MKERTATARVLEPGAVPVELTLTLTLADWQAVRKQLRDGGHTHYGPAAYVVDAIDDLALRVTERLDYEPPPPPRPGAPEPA